MCGICGEVTFNGDAAGGSLAAMTRQMWPRGPDAGGTFSQNRVAFGHAPAQHHRCRDRGGISRSVQSAASASSSTARSTITASLRRALEQRRPPLHDAVGHRSDLLASTRTRGIACLAQLEGMFAICLYDPGSEQRLFLARDRLGKKPLYWAERPGRFRFASTLPALLAAGDVDTAIDPAALHHYLSWHAVVPAPLTIIKGVRKLAPATICIIEPDGRRREEVYWQLEVGPRAGGSRAHRGGLARGRSAIALGKAVDRRRVADVPVGVLLSGGLDSSLLGRASWPGLASRI